MRLPSIAFVAAATLAIAPSDAGAASFSNPTPITMPNAGAPAPASPYPTVVSVAGLQGTVTDANVTLNSFSHNCLSDADVLLTGPGGQRSLLLSDAGGYCPPPAVGATITLDDEATTTYPCDATPSGTFKPTNDPVTGTHCLPTPDAFPPPAPPGPYPVTLSGFDGASPNGDWSLFVFDESGGDAGSMAGGWSLELLTTNPAPATNVACAGKPATLTGTSGADGLTGTASADVIVGAGGNDTVNGLGGDDVICGGDGKDRLRGGRGKDLLRGEATKDVLIGGRGRDRCVGGAKADKAKGCEKQKSI